MRRTMLEAARALRCAVLGLALALAGCDGCRPASGPPDSGSEPDGGAYACSVHLSYRPSTTSTSIGVVGEWNGFDGHAHRMADPEGDGTYELELALPPGLHAYAFLENGAERADPDAAYLEYVEGRTWSAMRVPECPSLSVEPGSASSQRPSPGQGSFTARLEVRGSVGGGVPALVGTLRRPGDRVGSASEPRALTSQELVVSEDGRSATVQLSGLPDGKYTVRIQASEGERAGEPLLLPFWVEPEAFSFRDSPIYMMVTDRFRDGDPGNNGTNPPEVELPVRFQGGDFKGVELAIREGYFDQLGIRAIWLTPWQTQPSRASLDETKQHRVMGYHGYWPVRAREVEPRLGGAEALHAMVEEAHRRGIRIIMDAVLNHVHEDHEYFADPARRSWFRTGCVCGSSSSCSWDAQRLSCLFEEYMPDVDWTVSEASEQLIADVLWWMEEFDLDGLRLDAVKHVEDAAIQNLAGRVRERFETAGTDYFIFGETFSGDYGLVRHYVGPRMLDAQLDFPLFMSMPERVFARDDDGLQLARAKVHDSLREFGGAPMVTFIGNHDVARFITKADPQNRDLQGNKWNGLPGAPVGQLPYDRLWLGMVHLMTTPGVPLVYYGDEYGEFGGSDPDNRHLLNREPNLWPEQRAQLQRMRALLTARRSLKGLARGALVELWCNEEPWGSGKGNLCAYARPDPDPRHGAVVVLNLTYNPWTGVWVRFPDELGWPSSGTVRDLLTGGEWSYSGSGVTLDVPARGGVVLGLK